MTDTTDEDPKLGPESEGQRRRFPMKAIEALFHGALDRPSGSLRESWLRGATGGDEGLFGEVQALLAAHETVDNFLDGGPLLRFDPKNDDAHEAEVDAGVGAVLGPYRLIESLGEGGFGVVYRAEQTEPVKREVALKIIKLGMDTRQVIARFEAERQALALMDHPSISRVLDAGSTEGGRPYFVMDLVPGEDLTRFCDSEALSIRERCGVFLDLCSAVQHAHQRGIIHRDLKPSNVLVARIEGRVLPKVIDFGIAKATTETPAEDAAPGEGLRTEMGQVIGTPVYMSPEQATGKTDIDTRTDVYSLGVIFYELLCGEAPISSVEIRDQAMAGTLGAFLESHVAPLPSMALAAAGDAASRAKARGGALTEVRSSVRGDMDFIALRALESERERRYESAADLARDVSNALANRPIAASPPSSIYRARKFLRRHRIAAGAAAAVLVATLGGLVVAWDSLRARRNQADVLSTLFRAATLTTPGDVNEAVGGVEKKAVDAYGPDDPMVVYALAMVATRLERAGAMGPALEARERMLATAIRIHGERSSEVLFARSAVGNHLARVGRPKEAKDQLTQAVQLDETLSPPGTPFINASRLELARLAIEEGNLELAESLVSKADSIARALAPRDRRMRADALQALINVYTRAGANSRARETWKELFGVLEQLSTETSTALPRERVRCGRWLATVGRSEESAMELVLALRAIRQIPDHPLELEFEALHSFNEVASDLPRFPPQLADNELQRELVLAEELFDADTAAFQESLRRVAQHYERRGEVAEELRILLRLYRTLADTGATRNRKAQLDVLAGLLGSKAMTIRGLDRLETDDYKVAADAIALAIERQPGSTALLLAQIELYARSGNPLKTFRLMEELVDSNSVDPEHPMFMALRAVAYHGSSTNDDRAKVLIREAAALSQSPRYMGVPGLQETIQWASGLILMGDGQEGGEESDE